MGKSIKDQLGRVIKQDQPETPPPVVVLVNPQMGENIGSAARVMLNFGLSEMRLVAPRDGWPNPKADSLAAGAVEVLENAVVFDDTASAMADIDFAMAATARRRELEIPVIGTGEAGALYRAQQIAGRRTAILFGPEKAGLTNEDVVLCDHILTYPINPAFQSLNLAQAVSVFSYLWAASEGATPPDIFQEHISPPAKRADLVNMMEHLEDELEESGFFFPAAKTPLMQRNIRAPFVRAKMTDQEVRTFRGIIKSLVRGRGQK